MKQKMKERAYEREHDTESERVFEGGSEVCTAAHSITLHK